MALSPGTRVGSYEILSALGAGGMGEVYRAYDPSLGRDVAIKILPDAFATDSERLARFKREAKTLAALNHPNIAHVYGFEVSSGVHALVMELIEGPTLADHIAEGPLPLDEALKIAKQIAEALEAAHEHGIVHRDLKPANIKVRDDGTVKVLDFGLAKSVEPVGASTSASQSPTISTPAMSRAGIIMGTAAYMSPEQAKGKPVDKRTDVWAFACVLYEMLTGRRAFEGEDVSDTIAAVLRGEPDWAALPAAVPPQVQTIIRRGLEKDRTARIPDLSVARFMIDDAGAAEVTTSAAAGRASTTRMERRGWIAAALLGAAFLAATGLAAFLYFRQAPADPRAIRFTLPMPEGWSLAVAGFPAPGTPPISVSPDGRRIAFVAINQNTQRLWIRSLDALEPQQLPGTEGAVGPFWSPDGGVLGFFADGKLKKINVAGGPPVTLCDAPRQLGGAWSPAGFILFGSSDKGIQRVATAGGVPTLVTKLAEGERGHTRPAFLPDGKHFFYRVFFLAVPAGGPLYVGSVDSAERKMVMERPDASNVTYAAGHLLFLRETTLMAQPFDLERLALTGEPVPVAEQVSTLSTPPVAITSMSQTGVLAFRTGAPLGWQLTWFDRSGKAVGTLGDRALYADIELSPDRTRVAVSIRDEAQQARDIWIVDVARGLRTRFTFEPSDEMIPIWSPDGSRIVYASTRKSGAPDLYEKPSDLSGAEKLLLSDDRSKIPLRWSPDGRFLPYVVNARSPRSDIWMLPWAGDRKPFPFLNTSLPESEGQISPDGRWMAYVSNDSKSSQVFVVPFPGPGGKVQVSTTGGSYPRWRDDGREIFYLDPENQLVAASVTATSAAFHVGEVRPLFRTAAVLSERSPYDVSKDGQRFLINTVDTPRGNSIITVVVNWPAMLKK